MIKHNIKTIMTDKQLNGSLSNVIAASPAIKAWKVDPATKIGHVDCKRRSFATGLNEFKKLYDVSEFFILYRQETKFFKDDSVEIFYRQKSV